MQATPGVQLIVASGEPPTHPEGELPVTIAGQVLVVELHVPLHAYVNEVQVWGGQLCTVAASGNPRQPEGLPVAVLVWMDPTAHGDGVQEPYFQLVQAWEPITVGRAGNVALTTESVAEAQVTLGEVAGVNLPAASIVPVHAGPVESNPLILSMSKSGSQNKSGVEHELGMTFAGLVIFP